MAVNEKDRLAKLSGAQKANKELARKIIEETYPGINNAGLDAILRNIGLETSFSSVNGQEKPWTVEDIENASAKVYPGIKSNLKKFLATEKPLMQQTSGAAGPQQKQTYTRDDYEKLSNEDKLSVMYYGKTGVKYAGGYGALQVTSANYGSTIDNKKFQSYLDDVSSKMGITSDELFTRLKEGDFEAGTRFSLAYYNDAKQQGRKKAWTTQKLNSTTPTELRKDINPSEKFEITDLPDNYSKNDSLVRRLEWLDVGYFDDETGKVVASGQAEIEDPSSVIATEGDEKPVISPLRQSVIDKFLKQRKDPNAERLMRARMGDEMVDKILRGGEREIEEYVRSLDEDDLVQASDMTAEEVANRIKAIGDQEPELKQEEEFVKEILNNPSLYSADLVKQAKAASKAIIDYRARGMAGYALFSDAEEIKKNITEKLKAADLEGLLRKKSEEEGRLRDKQTGVEDIDLIGKLPDAALPEGIEDAKIKFTDDELTDIQEEEEDDEDVTIGLSKRKRKKALRKAGATPESKLTQFLKNAKLDLGDVSQAMNAAGFALSAGAGIMSIAEAREKDSVSKSQVDPLFTEAVNKVRAASETGMPYEQRQAAMKDINNAYVGAMKNVMAISGGQRGLALANVGVVDANRLNSLVDLASKDSDMRQKNLELFAKTSAEYSNQKLTADMNFQKLKATLDDNRKNRLADIGSNLLEQAQQYGANYTATRMADKLMDKQNDADRVQNAVNTYLQNNPAYIQSFTNELAGIDQNNNLDSDD